MSSFSFYSAQHLNLRKILFSAVSGRVVGAGLLEMVHKVLSAVGDLDGPAEHTVISLSTEACLGVHSLASNCRVASSKVSGIKSTTLILARRGFGHLDTSGGLHTVPTLFFPIRTGCEISCWSIISHATSSIRNSPGFVIQNIVVCTLCRKSYLLCGSPLLNTCYRTSMPWLTDSFLHTAIEEYTIVGEGTALFVPAVVSALVSDLAQLKAHHVSGGTCPSDDVFNFTKACEWIRVVFTTDTMRTVTASLLVLSLTEQVTHVASNIMIFPGPCLAPASSQTHGLTSLPFSNAWMTCISRCIECPGESSCSTTIIRRTDHRSI